MAHTSMLSGAVIMTIHSEDMMKVARMKVFSLKSRQMEMREDVFKDYPFMEDQSEN